MRTKFKPTREWWVVRARRSYHRVFSRILHNMDRAHLRKYWKRPNCPKRPYYNKAIFMVVRFEENGDYGGFRSQRI